MVLAKFVWVHGEKSNVAPLNNIWLLSGASGFMDRDRWDRGRGPLSGLASMNSASISPMVLGGQSQIGSTQPCRGAKDFPLEFRLTPSSPLHPSLCGTSANGEGSCPLRPPCTTLSAPSQLSWPLGSSVFVSSVQQPEVAQSHSRSLGGHPSREAQRPCSPLRVTPLLSASRTCSLLS